MTKCAQNNIPAIIIGLETNGLAVVRALGGNGVNVFIIEDIINENQPHLSTKYGKKILIDLKNKKKLVNILSVIAGSFSKVILFLTTDKMVSWFSKNRELLPINLIHCLPSDSTVQMLLKKDLFTDFVLKHDFCMPKSKIINSDSDKVFVEKAFTFPVILKPIEKAYGTNLPKAIIANTKEELLTSHNIYIGSLNKYIAQEYIPGGDDAVYFCMQYRNKDGCCLASFTGKKIRQWKPKSGGTASCEPVHLPYLHKLTEQIFKQSNFWGVGSVEFKKDYRNGKYFIIEPTVSRTDFQENVAICNGVNIPYIAYCDLAGLPVTKMLKSNKNKGWMHLTHDRLSSDYYISKGELSFIKWLWSLRRVRCFDLLDFCDMGPFLKRISMRLTSKFK